MEGDDFPLRLRPRRFIRNLRRCRPAPPFWSSTTSRSSATSLGEYLRSIGHSAVACADGLEALAHARKSRFDMALCDVNLPGMDGHDVVQSLLRLDPEIMCILVTAYATIESAVEAFQRGAVDYLMKPILFEDLRRKIDRFHADACLDGRKPEFAPRDSPRIPIRLCRRQLAGNETDRCAVSQGGAGALGRVSRRRIRLGQGNVGPRHSPIRRFARPADAIRGRELCGPRPRRA